VRGGAYQKGGSVVWASGPRQQRPEGPRHEAGAPASAAWPGGGGACFACACGWPACCASPCCFPACCSLARTMTWQCQTCGGGGDAGGGLGGGSFCRGQRSRLGVPQPSSLPPPPLPPPLPPPMTEPTETAHAPGFQRSSSRTAHRADRLQRRRVQKHDRVPLRRREPRRDELVDAAPRQLARRPQQPVGHAGFEIVREVVGAPHEALTAGVLRVDGDLLAVWWWRGWRVGGKGGGGEGERRRGALGAAVGGKRRARAAQRRRALPSAPLMCTAASNTDILMKSVTLA
jgi:hypothetical protein